jgi:hypothetical protein
MHLRSASALGTAHAVLSARNAIHGPFSAINADDFYGAGHSPRSMKRSWAEARRARHVRLSHRKYLTENGTVSRGVCSVENGLLTGVVERTKIRPAPDGAAYTLDGEHWTGLPAGTLVSMNMWGFGAGMMDAIEEYFAAFLQENLPKNPLCCEYYLPYVVNRLIEDKRATARVLPCEEKWYGVTYMEDLPGVRRAIEGPCDAGKYPEALWPSEKP